MTDRRPTIGELEHEVDRLTNDLTALSRERNTLRAELEQAKMRSASGMTGTKTTLIGRIVDHGPDWEWVRLEGGHGQVQPGDALRLKYHPEANWRPGIAPVLCQDGDRIYTAGVMWWEAIAAIADRDYVYRVEPAP